MYHLVPPIIQSAFSYWVWTEKIFLKHLKIIISSKTNSFSSFLKRSAPTFQPLESYESTFSSHWISGFWFSYSNKLRSSFMSIIIFCLGSLIYQYLLGLRTGSECWRILVLCSLITCHLCSFLTQVSVLGLFITKSLWNDGSFRLWIICKFIVVDRNMENRFKFCWDRYLYFLV